MVLAQLPPPDDQKSGPVKTDYRRVARIGLIIVLVTFGILGGWAAFAPLSAAVIGRGTITVESNRKTVQHLEGGIVRKILVHEGQQVQAGQLLFELDPVQPTAQLGITRNALFTLLARADRLTAERDGLASIRFSPELLAQQSDPLVRQAVTDETLQFQERRRTISGQIEILNARVGQLREQIEGIDRQRASMEDQVKFLNEEISGLNELYEQQLVPKPRILALERERASTRGQIGRMIAEKASALKAIGESQLQARQIRQEFDEAVAKELAEVQAQITEYREKYTVAEDVARRVRITSPVTGTAQNLRVFTEGAVVRSAEPLVDIVPARSDFVIQAQFSPNDADSLVPGQVAELRFPSFHTRNIPVIEGTVASVSRDRLVDEASKEPYFLVVINLKDAKIPRDLRGKLVAGMPAEVVVPTGDRTALEYLLSPLGNALRKTMREE